MRIWPGWTGFSARANGADKARVTIAHGRMLLTNASAYPCLEFAIAGLTRRYAAKISKRSRPACGVRGRPDGKHTLCAKHTADRAGIEKLF